MKQFTRDEAIAIVKTAIDADPLLLNDERTWLLLGARRALEALAAAGVFVDHEADNVLHAAWLRDKLDAAGIR